MRIVRIYEGLGNQMFQQALLISLHKSSGEPVLADISDYKRRNRHNGYELERVFGIKNRIATNKEILRYTFFCNNPTIQEFYRKLSHFRYGDIKERRFGRFIPNLVKKHKHGYYDGYWQCYKYFEPYKEEVISSFQFINPLEGDNKEIATEIITVPHSVSIHVRRGDYLNYYEYKGLCNLDYYKKAIHYIINQVKTPVHFYVFSNDIDWCKINLTPLLKGSVCKFVDWNTGIDSYIDMQLMSICKSNIIANSSFSWWAAYLNNNRDKIVIAPQKWINKELEYQIQYPGWITL